MKWVGEGRPAPLSGKELGFAGKWVCDLMNMRDYGHPDPPFLKSPCLRMALNHRLIPQAQFSTKS